MKKLIIVFITTIIFNKAKAQIDTVGILNSLVSNKSQFINQPLSKLLGAMGNLRVYDNSGVIPLDRLPDTLEFQYMNLYINENIILKHDPLKPSHIRIKFIAALPIPKYYFYEGNILDCNARWNIKKQLYFGQFLISDFTIH